MSWHRRKAPPELEPEGVPMTPMIDITFQLLLFFMIATDMGSRQVEALTVPYASKATPLTEYEIVLNLTTEGHVRMGGRTFSDEALENFFQCRFGRHEGMGPPLLIRADRSTAYEHLQKVLVIAAHHGRVTRVDLCAKPERSQP